MADRPAASGGPSPPFESGRPALGGRRGRRPVPARLWLARSLTRWLFLTLPLIVLAAVVAGLIATGQPLNAPARLTRMAETRASEVARSLIGPDVVVQAQGGADLVLERGIVPRLRLRGLTLAQPGRPALARIEELRVALDPGALMRGQFAPRRVRLIGVTVQMVRHPDGAVTLAGLTPAATGGPVMRWGGGPQGASPALAGLRAVLAAPALAALSDARVEGLRLALFDQATGRRWQAQGGMLSLTRDATGAEARAAADLTAFAPGAVPGATPQPAGRLSLRLHADPRGPAARLEAALDAVPAPALAAQHPALSWLGLVEAPVSGALKGGIDPLGQVAPLDLTLTLGAGHIRPGGGAGAVALKGALADLRYDPARARLVLRRVALDSRALHLEGAGHADLVGPDPMRPEALVGQITLHRLAADPEGVFAAPARFDRGQADLRLRLDPLRLDIGQVTLAAGSDRLTARGQLRADAAGWAGALDFEAPQIALDRLLALWPLRVAGKTRDWLSAHVTTGNLQGARGALRLAPGAEPVLALSYGFSGAEVRVVKTLPPVRDGAGYATVADNAHVLVVDRGTIAAPGRPGETIDVARTVLSVPDIRARPARAEAELHLAGSIPAALSLLDQPPFEILKKAGRSPDLAQGQAQIVARIGMPLIDKVPKDQVDFRVDGTLRDVVSTTLVPQRELRAPRLDLRADRADGLRIAGAGTLSGVAFDAEWRQGFAAADKGRSHLSGTVAVTPDGLRAFGIALPDGMVSGSGRGQLEMRFIKGAEGPFTFTTDLVGLGLALPQIGWTKPGAARGSLTVKGAIPPRGVRRAVRIEAIDLTAPGLSARGDMVLRHKDEGGGMLRADLTAVSAGDWFDGAVRLTGRGKGQPPGVEITGGRADLTRAPFGKLAPARAEGAPMPIRLDRLQVTRAFHLTGVSARIASGPAGPSGSFSGRLNGQAPVTGRVEAGEGRRAAIRLTAEDAGAVLAASGLYGKATGGSLALRLDPARGKAGNYDGQVRATGIRVAGTGALGDALTQGKAEAARANGGILFDRVEGRFRITPDAIEITEGAAVGPTLGVSAAGLFLPRSGSLHIKGTISPLFALNPGGGQSGEALFGFAYKLRGTAKAPEVSVNPASILAPGGLRDLFRRPPPTLENLRYN